MFRNFRILIVCCVVLYAVSAASPALALKASDAPGSAPLEVGETFPNVALDGEITDANAAALGLDPAAESWTINDIDVPVLIFQVFSMYCPHCQNEAPVMVRMDEFITELGKDDTIEIVGLGAGNSQTEVNIFRDKYDIEFPLFPDMEFEAYKPLGSVGTPYFYVLKKDDAAGAYTVVISQLGRVNGPESFVDEVILETGL